MANSFNGILRLRRDLESNYEIVKNVFIPASGEVCIVDCSGKLPSNRVYSIPSK